MWKAQFEPIDIPIKMASNATQKRSMLMRVGDYFGHPHQNKISQNTDFDVEDDDLPF